MRDEPRLALLYASANGGVRPSKLVLNRKTGEMQRVCVAGGVLQAMGVTAGVPDVFLSCPVGPDPGIYLELKKAGLTPRQAWAACSEDQRFWLERFAQAGYQTTVCSGWVQAARVLCTYLRAPQVARSL